MRLLHYLADGNIGRTGDLEDATAHSYAILSHTWASDDEEVMFDDLTSGAYKKKAGYKKIQFCLDKAIGDGLKYVWVDSCCIDKTNKVELQHAISSMFSWYQRAAKCYVYLSDVSGKQANMEQQFRGSRWFNRGWTLQELLAPVSVEFFSKDGSRLGDSQSLQALIQKTTGIPREALKGNRSLSSFTVAERFGWAEFRQTKLEEDSAYSLLGIFGISMTLRYGEGKAQAIKRLDDEIHKQETCIRDLRLLDPHYHKKRIEQRKGGLLKNSYRWILENHEFCTWRNNNSNRNQVLWIKGGPGKGKTMLLCGIINELQKDMTKRCCLSYFFCEASDSQVNSGTAVLRGLLYMLVSQRPALASHLRKEYDRAGKAVFEDSNAWFTLSEIFTEVILECCTSSDIYLVIDALDEVLSTDLRRFLQLITRRLPASSQVKWLISSRNEAAIERQLRTASHETKLLCLELCAESIYGAITSFIEHRAERLPRSENFDHETQETVLKHLLSHVQSAFLWFLLFVSTWKILYRLWYKQD